MLLLVLVALFLFSAGLAVAQKNSVDGLSHEIAHTKLRAFFEALIEKSVHVEIASDSTTEACPEYEEKGTNRSKPEHCRDLLAQEGMERGTGRLADQGDWLVGAAWLAAFASVAAAGFALCAVNLLSKANDKADQMVREARKTVEATHIYGAAQARAFVDVTDLSIGDHGTSFMLNGNIKNVGNSPVRNCAYFAILSIETPNGLCHTAINGTTDQIAPGNEAGLTTKTFCSAHVNSAIPLQQYRSNRAYKACIVNLSLVVAFKDVFKNQHYYTKLLTFGGHRATVDGVTISRFITRPTSSSHPGKSWSKPHSKWHQNEPTKHNI